MQHKIKIIYYDIENKLAVESLWALQQGEYYVLQNIPFYAPNLAYGDIISVEDEDGELYFDDLIKSSGNSTIQIVFLDETQVNHVENELINYGLSWEGSDKRRYISVNIPSSVNYMPIKGYLDDLEVKEVLSYKEACLLHDYMTKEN